MNSPCNPFLLLIVLSDRLDRFAGEVRAQFLIDLDVYLGEHDGGMDLAALEIRQLLQGASGIFVMTGLQRQGDEHLIRVEPGISAAQVADFQVLDRLNGLGLDQLRVMLHSCQIF